MTVELPAGIQHGTPEGFAAGCRREKDCPALHTHGMCCLFAHVRSQTDPRYFRAKVRDPRPAAIAQRLGIRPPRPAVAAVEEQLDEEAAERSQTEIYQPGRGWHKRPAGQPPVNNPEPRESAETEATDTPPVKHESANPDPAQPLAEQSQDPDPQEDAGAPAIEDQTPAAATSDVEGEDTGHPTTTEETTVNTTTEQPVDAFAARCADAIATAAGRKKIRDWARAQGFVVPSRGKIPALYVRSFVQAQDGTDANETPNPADATSEPQSATQPAIDETPDDPETTTTPDALAREIREKVIAAGPFSSLGAAVAYESHFRSNDGLSDRWFADLDGAVWPGPLSIYWALTEDQRPAEQPAQWLEAYDDATAPPAPVEDLVVEVDLTPPDAFRPEWADVAIAEDVNAVRLTAARLKEECARLQRDLIDAEEARATAERSLAFTLGKLFEERDAHAAQLQAIDGEIENYIKDRRALLASKRLLGSIVEQAHATITTQARDLRAAQQTAALPFWRRRR